MMFLDSSSSLSLQTRFWAGLGRVSSGLLLMTETSLTFLRHVLRCWFKSRYVKKFFALHVVHLNELLSSPVFVASLIVWHWRPFLLMFFKRCGMSDQCLVQSITKKSHFILIGSWTTTIYSLFKYKNSMKIIRNFFFISNYLWSNAKISKYGKKKKDKFWSDSLIEKY